ncbi:MAG: polysaccharide biosynthesis protein [Lysobacteraceae bacterium]|nr:MAG: polysaccharide biosynthesis protein [Xanthomonadaceae bacterium]
MNGENDPHRHDEAHTGTAEAESARAQPMTRLRQEQALTTRQLEERRLIHRHESMREHADAFRELRTRLLSVGAGPGSEGRNFVTLVAPVQHGSGGSYVARNLATAFAFDESKQALLIDCDATHPTQGPALQVEAEHGGLIDYLENETLPLAEIVYPTGVPRLHLTPSGRIRETPGESFSSFRMRAMIDSLRAHHANRHLILDGPPVQGSPDARILSDLADLVVLVVGYGRVTTEAIEKAVASFPPEKFAGIVFNRRP